MMHEIVLGRVRMTVTASAVTVSDDEGQYITMTPTEMDEVVRLYQHSKEDTNANNV